MLAIETDALTKVYRVGFWSRRLEVLRDLNLGVPEGEIFGYLGPNGAGKSTTLKLLMGLVHPSAGCAEVLGYPIGDPRGRRRVGFLPENPSFYDYLSGQELLAYCGRLLGLRGTPLRNQVVALLHEVGLSRAAAQQIRKYSKGMVQRLGLAQALLGEPELLILDEPMSGLDPIGRKEVRDIILRQRAAGRTVFFSTHILSDVEIICDRVGILVNGALVKTGPIAELLGEQIDSIEVTVSDAPEPILRELQEFALGSSVRQQSRTMVRVNGEAELQKVLSILVDAGCRVLSVVPHRRGLEEIFLQAHSEGGQ